MSSGSVSNRLTAVSVCLLVAVSLGAAEKVRGNGDAGGAHRVLQAYSRLPLGFEANRGQTDPRVKFLARGSGYMLFLGGDGATLQLRCTAGDCARRRFHCG